MVMAAITLWEIFVAAVVVILLIFLIGALR